MCGIFAILNSSEPVEDLKSLASKLSARIRHRGPDSNGLCVQTYGSKANVLAHERLGIVGLSTGSQPLFNTDGSTALVANGEIYNHKKFRFDQTLNYKFKTESDSEVIIPIYEKYGDQCVNLLDGIFSFVIAGVKDGKSHFLAARDPIGVTSLYAGFNHDGSIWFSSEMKALKDDCDRIVEFPPGHYMSSETPKFTRWYNAPWVSEIVPKGALDLPKLANALENAVVKRLMADVPYGVLLSGGLDSSLIASIAARQMLKGQPQGTRPKLLSFSIGLENSPDLKAAKFVADFLGTDHHEFTFTVEEGIKELRNVIYHIETYDVTSIRASTPMYFLAKKIKEMGVKMVLSGEGSDEIFGGYLYFHKAPSPQKFHVELCHKLKLLSKYDCLRANKSTSAWGVECRCPFLDREFLDVAMGVDPAEKMIVPGRIEKYIIRKAFDSEENPYLPSSILWRQKEQFSDGVGYNWIDTLKSFAASQVTDEQFENAATKYPYNTPTTKEGYYYREIFSSLFPAESCAKTVPGGPSIACSTPAAIEWEKAWKNMADPSGRAVAGVHNVAVKVTV